MSLHSIFVELYFLYYEEFENISSTLFNFIPGWAAGRVFKILQ